MKIVRPGFETDTLKLKKIEIQKVIAAFENWIEIPKLRMTLSRDFEELVGNCEILDATPQQNELLSDLCHDFAYYTQDPAALREEPTLWNDEKMRDEIKSVLKQLKS